MYKVIESQLNGGECMFEFFTDWMPGVAFIGVIFLSIGFRRVFSTLTTLQKIGFILIWVGLILAGLPDFISGFIDGSTGK